jgi:hypothetical protein
MRAMVPLADLAPYTPVVGGMGKRLFGGRLDASAANRLGEETETRDRRDEQGNQGGGHKMAKQPMKNSEKKKTTSLKLRDLRAKPLGADKIASLKGGKAVL